MNFLVEEQRKRCLSFLISSQFRSELFTFKKLRNFNLLNYLGKLELNKVCLRYYSVYISKNVQQSK